MISTSYFGDKDEIQAVFFRGHVCTIRDATGFSFWDGRASAWTTVKRFDVSEEVA